jgi:hypothetical protein
MNELDELIRQQASYDALVAWIQKRDKCEYLQACLKLNQVLKQYRLQHSVELP